MRIRNFEKKQFHRGFSLIEILIAVGIFASSLIFILPVIYSSENEIKKNLRTLQAVNRTLYSHSRIQNKVYRLVFQTHLKQSSYWVEIKNPVKEVEMIASINAEDQKSDNPLNSDSKHFEHPFFEKNTDFLETQTLPSGVYFEWPESQSDENIVYITYDPHSFSHAIKIFLLKDNQLIWTLLFNPILGELELSQDENT